MGIVFVPRFFYLLISPTNITYLESETIPISYDVKYVDDPGQEVGYHAIKQEGVQGVRTNNYEVHEL